MDGERARDPSPRVQTRSVTLWDVLTLLSFSGGLGGTIGAARAAHASTPRLALAALWGVLLGIGCVYCARVAGERLLERDSSERLLPLLYLAAGAWIWASTLICFILTAGLIRLLP
jgi:hypothetical protein